MGSFVDTYNREGAADYRLRVLNQDFKGKYPLLGTALTGVLTDDAKTLALPPCKLILYADVGELTACLCPEIGGKKSFLSLGNGLCSWAEAVEAYLSNGVRWVSTRKQKNS